MAFGTKTVRQLLTLLLGFYPLVALGEGVTRLPTSPMSQNQPSLYDRYPWSLMYYYGMTFDNPLVDVMTLHHLHRWPENIQSLELAYTLDEKNFLRRFLNPLVDVVQIAGNITIRSGKNESTIYEFDPYLLFRWTNFPWNHHIHTSLALAEGVSYDSTVPTVEKKHSSNTKYLLNYLALEATFALPQYPRWQLVVRIHHRSGAYGLYHAGNAGSNDWGLGARYLF